MSIATEITNYANGLGDAYGAVNDMGGIIPQDKNMNNLDTAIRTIPQSTGPTYVAGNGIDITNDVISADTTVVATQTDLAGKQDTLTAGTNITISNNTISASIPVDSALDVSSTNPVENSVVTAALNGKAANTDMTGATSSAAGAHGLVPAPAAGDQDKVLHGDGTWGDTTAKLVEMSYGESNAWAKFIAAYNAGSIVYCRASSNANPGTGSQTRKAFMAYVNNATNPTSVEFQYVRSQSSKTDSQQCDQVFVYTLTNASGGTWSVASRDMATKINVDSTLNKTYSSGANASMTLGAKTMTGATSSAAGAAGVVPAPAAGDDTKFLAGDGTWKAAGGGSTYTAGNGIDITNDVISIDDTVVAELSDIPTVNDATLTIQHNGTNVQTFTANQSTNATANIETIYADTIAPASPVAPISTSMVADGAITASKIDFTSFIAGTADFTAVSAGGSNDVSVNIPTQANTDYLIFLQLAGHTGYWTDLVYRPNTKTTTSFTITAYNSGNGATGSFSINYLVIPQ